MSLVNQYKTMKVKSVPFQVFTSSHDNFIILIIKEELEVVKIGVNFYLVMRTRYTIPGEQKIFHLIFV